MKRRKITAIYGFLIGAAMIITWGVMLTAGKTGKVGLELGFHIAAELVTAVLMILAGILILKKSMIERQSTYFALGMLLQATLGAFVEYVVNLQWAISIPSAATFLITLVFVIVNFEKLEDFTFLTLGVVLYGCMNILGEALESVVDGPSEQPMWGSLAYVSLMGVAGVVLVVFKLCPRPRTN